MTLYPSIFSRGYWQEAVRSLKNLRVLTFAALLVALGSVVDAFYIPVGNAVQIHFSFLAVAVSSLVCGPLTALLSGCASDLISFFLFPTGDPFFPGYTLSAMLVAFLYALFFYRARITWLRIIICKAVINFGVNVAIGCVWRSMLYGKGYFFYLGISSVKNIALLPLEVILLAILLRLLIPTLAKGGLIPPMPDRHFPFMK